uniref:Uncharacterized protein n=1 Tax=Chenopodium quinoa TaxID=63459 RepID=A0A803NAJ3_CHEQI
MLHSLTLNLSCPNPIKRLSASAPRVSSVATTIVSYSPARVRSNKLKFELVHDKVTTFSKAMERAKRIIEASDVYKTPSAKEKGKRKPEDNYHDNKNKRPRRVESEEAELGTMWISEKSTLI